MRRLSHYEAGEWAGKHYDLYTEIGKKCLRYGFPAYDLIHIRSRAEKWHCLSKNLLGLYTNYLSRGKKESIGSSESYKPIERNSLSIADACGHLPDTIHASSPINLVLCAKLVAFKVMSQIQLASFLSQQGWFRQQQIRKKGFVNFFSAGC